MGLFVSHLGLACRQPGDLLRIAIVRETQIGTAREYEAPEGVALQNDERWRLKNWDEFSVRPKDRVAAHIAIQANSETACCPLPNPESSFEEDRSETPRSRAYLSRAMEDQEIVCPCHYSPIQYVHASANHKTRDA